MADSHTKWFCTFSCVRCSAAPLLIIYFYRSSAIGNSRDAAPLPLERIVSVLNNLRFILGGKRTRHGIDHSLLLALAVVGPPMMMHDVESGFVR